MRTPLKSNPIPVPVPAGFKVGDQVRLIQADRKHECARAGQTGEVIGFNGPYVMLHLKCGHVWEVLSQTVMHQLTPLSPEAQEARKPLPPEELVNALPDRCHKEVGVSRPAKSSKQYRCKVCGGLGHNSRSCAKQGG
jgi:hypothetical protein